MTNSDEYMEKRGFSYSRKKATNAKAIFSIFEVWRGALGLNSSHIRRSEGLIQINLEWNATKAQATYVQERFVRATEPALLVLKKKHGIIRPNSGQRFRKKTTTKKPHFAVFSFSLVNDGNLAYYGSLQFSLVESFLQLEISISHSIRNFSYCRHALSFFLFSPLEERGSEWIRV